MSSIPSVNARTVAAAAANTGTARTAATATSRSVAPTPNHFDDYYVRQLSDQELIDSANKHIDLERRVTEIVQTTCREIRASWATYFRANRLTAVWNDYKLTPEMVTLIRRMNFYDNQLILILRRMRTARLEIQRRNQLLMETLRNQEAAGNEGEGDGVAHE